MYKSLCDLWKTDFHFFPPQMLYVSNITQDALLSVQNKSPPFYTCHLSNECFFFFLLYSLQRKKTVTAEIPHHQQKVLLKMLL